MTPTAGNPSPLPSGGTQDPPLFRWLALAAILLFLLLIARYWHPVYRFTAFLQMSEDGVPVMIGQLKDIPILVYPGSNGYDGQSYAQIAYDPTVTSPELPGALDNVSYRASRILAPSLAWLFAAGQPHWIVHAYSVLNIAAWFSLAALTWKLLRVADTRTFVAWAGLLFSAGALHSVRLALTDLVALVFFAAGFLALESRRTTLATGLFSLAGLGRETCLAAAFGLWNGPWRSVRAWIKNGLLVAAVVAPYALWILYLRHLFPSIDGSPSHLAIPGIALLEKIHDSLTFLHTTNDPFLAWSTLLSVVALLVQAVYLITRPRPQDPWWRAGIPFVVLMLVLNRAVWEGDPGAITRVLLPLQLAFNVLASRHRAPLALLLAGNLSLFSGLAPFRSTPHAGLHEIGHGRLENASIVVRGGDGWYDTERSWSQTRTWSQATSRLEIQAWPASARTTAALDFKIRAHSTCTVTIRQTGRVLWHGRLDTEKQPVLLKDILVENGRATLDFSSDPPAHAEGTSPDPRQLSFALYNLRVIDDRQP